MAERMAENCLLNVVSAGSVILLVTAFPIAQITLGAVFIYECPAAPFVPVYVMVCGILALMIMGLFALSKLCPAVPNHKIWTLCKISVVLLVFVWSICGSYHIYSVYPPNYTKITVNPNSSKSSASRAPDDKPSLPLENQNKSFSNLNQTMVDNNQTLSFFQTLVLNNISSDTDREHLNAQRARSIMAAAPYCQKNFVPVCFLDHHTGFCVGRTCLGDNCLHIWLHEINYYNDNVSILR